MSQHTKIIAFECWLHSDGSLRYHTEICTDDCDTEVVGEAIGIFRLAAFRAEDAIGGAIKSSPQSDAFDRGVEKALSRGDDNREMHCRVEEVE